MRPPLIETCKTQYLLADGSLGTELRRMAGNFIEPVELLCINQPALVLSLHEQYIDAGAQCLTTNTFSANPIAIPGADASRCQEICEAATRLARQAAGADHYLLGSIGALSEWQDDAREVIACQARILTDSGVDAVLLETVTSLETARVMSQAVREAANGIPIIVSFAFEKVSDQQEFQLVGSGDSLINLAQSLSQINADGFGINCGRNLDAYDYSTIVSRLREHTGHPLIVQPSAGDPLSGYNGQPDYPESPEALAEALWENIRAGANIIGGCCGTTPEYTKAFRNELDMLG